MIVKNLSDPKKFIIAVVAAFTAAMVQFAWVSAALIPTALMLFIFSMYRTSHYTLIPPHRMPFFYICSIWFICHFLVFYDFSNSTTRDKIELFGVIVNIVFFAYFSRTYASRALPGSLNVFFVLVVAFHLLQDLIIGGGENKQVYAYTFFVVLPFLVVGVEFKRRKIILILFFFAMLQLLYFVNRVPALSFMLVLFVYYFWSWLSKSKWRYTRLILLFFTVIILLPYLYVESDISYADELSRQYFNKGIDGRMSIWPDIIDNIYSETWFGKCSNCGTQYYLNSLGTRNLSSHNTFLELTFRMGALGVLPFVLMLLSLLMHFYRNKHYKASQFGAAYLIGAIVFMSSNEFSMTQTFTSNLLFWSGLGLLYGRSKSGKRDK